MQPVVGTVSLPVQTHFQVLTWPFLAMTDWSRGMLLWDTFFPLFQTDSENEVSVLYKLRLALFGTIDGSVSQHVGDAISAKRMVTGREVDTKWEAWEGAFRFIVSRFLQGPKVTSAFCWWVTQHLSSLVLCCLTYLEVSLCLLRPRDFSQR